MTPTETETGREDASFENHRDSETPVNYVYLSDSVRQFIVEDCVLCGQTHRHGAKDPAVANGGRSHRAAHCANSGLNGGYYLELAPDAKPPERWYSWLDRVTGVEVEYE